MASPSGRAAKFQSLKQAPVKSRTLYFNAWIQRRPAPDFSQLIIHKLEVCQENNWWRRSSLHIFSVGPVTFCLFNFVNVQKSSPRIICDSARPGHQEQLRDQNFSLQTPVLWKGQRLVWRNLTCRDVSTPAWSLSFILSKICSVYQAYLQTSEILWKSINSPVLSCSV